MPPLRMASANENLTEGHEKINAKGLGPAEDAACCPALPRQRAQIDGVVGSFGGVAGGRQTIRRDQAQLRRTRGSAVFVSFRSTRH